MNVDLPEFRILSQCAGVAGLDLGVRLALPQARTVCYVEREITAVRVLAARMYDGSIDQAPLWTDIRTFDARGFRHRIHCLVAGYPCQPFSHAGLRRGREDQRHLWPFIETSIVQSQPEYVFFENVDGHLSLGFREVAQSLRRMGYQGEAGIFSAEEVGAPHRRKRLFVLAYREGGGCRELRESPWCAGLVDGRGQDLENPAWNGGDGPPRQSSGRRRGVREAGAGLVGAVADPLDGLLPLSWWDEEKRKGTRPAGPRLADSACDVGRRGISGAQTRTRPEEIWRRGSSIGGLSLADPGKGRLAKRRDGQHQEEECAPTLRSGLSFFPPGPDNLKAWQELLRFDPSLEPALCRTPDGNDSRVDRLRALGNGVVPLVAGFAFVSLARAIVARLDETAGSGVR